MLDTKLTQKPKFIRGIKGTETSPTIWPVFYFLFASDNYKRFLLSEGGEIKNAKIKKVLRFYFDRTFGRYRHHWYFGGRSFGFVISFCTEGPVLPNITAAGTGTNGNSHSATPSTISN
jgi:hypothetical protein